DLGYVVEGHGCAVFGGDVALLVAAYRLARTGLGGGRIDHHAYPRRGVGDFDVGIALRVFLCVQLSVFAVGFDLAHGNRSAQQFEGNVAGFAACLAIDAHQRAVVRRQVGVPGFDDLFKVGRDGRRVVVGAEVGKNRRPFAGDRHAFQGDVGAVSKKQSRTAFAGGGD